MVWIFAAVVLWLAVAVPSFRKILLIGAGVVVCVIVLVILFDSLPKDKESSKLTPAASALPPPTPKPIPPDDVETGEMRSDFVGSGGQVRNVTVRLFNHSVNETLSKADYRLTIADCKGRPGTKANATGGVSCATVHDETGSFEYIRIPPQQARDVSLTVQGFGVTILGSPKIDLKITAAQAE
jgi:hypothetical protein